MRIVRLYSVGALSVFGIGVALDASFLAHFQREYVDGAPVHFVDLLIILGGFAPEDLHVVKFLLPVLALAMITVAVNWYAGRVSRWIRIALGALQLPISAIGGVGAMVFLSTLPEAVGIGLDGEWLHNGTPLLGCLGVWSPVPIIVLFLALYERRS